MSYYDITPLKATLERLVDFDLINAGATRFGVGTVNIRNGNFVYFDNATDQIGPQHVMASGSLPSGFPATEIEGYDPAENPLTATYLGAHQTAGLSVRSVTLCLLGYPRAALADADQALADTREIDRAAPLIEALAYSCFLHILCGKHLIANALVDELIALAHEKEAFYLKAFGMSVQGWLFALTGKFGCSSRAHFGTSRMSLNGSNAGSAVSQIVFGQVLCRAWQIR
jgi:hypothetical protein